MNLSPIYRQINILANRQRRHFDRLTAEAPFSGAQGRVLHYLLDHPDEEIFQKDIEEEFGLRPSTATTLLQSMERKGLLRREPSEKDARYKKLGVSPVSSIPYTMTCVWGIEMGKATILFHVGLVLLQIILLRRLIGFISDGDILRFLAAEHPLYVNPSSLMTMDFDEKLQELMHCKVRDVARKSVITVNLSDDLGTVCHVLSDHHIKKAPILDDGDMVGVINASNITKYAFRRLEGIR